MGGKTPPPAPPPPNPYAVANAQTGSNVATATANTWLGNADENTPWGSVDYRQQTDETGNLRYETLRMPKLDRDGTPIDADNDGNVDYENYQIPIMERNVTLTTAQQDALDLQNQLGVDLNQLALDQTGKIGDLLSKPINPNQITPPRPENAPGTPDLANAPTAPTFDQVDLDNITGAGEGIQGSVNLDQARESFAAARPIIQEGVEFDPLKTGIGESGDVQTSVNRNNLATTFANSPELQQFLSQLGYTGSIGQAGAIQGKVTPGDYASTFGNTPNVQQNINLGNAATTFDEAGNIINRVGDSDYEGSRRSVEDAIFSRLNPELNRDRNALETRLINQGYQRGTQAFDRAMDEFNRQSNDARMQAVIAGGQEQSRLAGLDLQGRQFANQAQAQGFGQLRDRGLYGLNALAQNNQATLAEGQFGNQAQQQAYLQAMGRGSFANDATQMQNAANLSAGDFANRAQQQGYQQNVGRAEFDRQNTELQNQMLARQGTFANDAANAAYQQAQGRGAFANEAIQGNNAGMLAQGEFANRAQQQYLNELLARAGFSNQAQQQMNENLLSAGDFRNRANQQDYQQELGRAQFGRESLAQNNQAAMDEAAFRNAAQGQAYQQTAAQTGANNATQLQSTQFNNATDQQRFEDLMNATQFNNQTGQQNFGNQLERMNAQNTLRERALQELITLRSQPINEISALMSGGQVSMPQFSPYRAGVIANTPVADMVYKSAALENQQWMAQMQQQNAAMGGMYGLGSAGLYGLMGMFSDRRVKRDIKRMNIRLRSGPGIYTYRYLWDAPNVRRVGVMADDVKKVLPSAVANIGGIDAVNYSAALAA